VHKDVMEGKASHSKVGFIGKNMLEKGKPKLR
jgi:hypothetical protein